MHDRTTIRGVRSALRNWRAADLERYAYWLAPGHRWQEFDGSYYPQPPVEQIADLIARQRAEIETDALPVPARVSSSRRRASRHGRAPRRRHLDVGE